LLGGLAEGLALLGNSGFIEHLFGIYNGLFG
jgi:hypothetical protein